MLRWLQAFSNRTCERVYVCGDERGERVHVWGTECGLKKDRDLIHRTQPLTGSPLWSSTQAYMDMIPFLRQNAAMQGD